MFLVFVTLRFWLYFLSCLCCNHFAIPIPPVTIASNTKTHNVKLPKSKLLPMSIPFFSSMCCLTSWWNLSLNCGRFFIMCRGKFCGLLSLSLSLLRFLLPLTVYSVSLVSFINPVWSVINPMLFSINPVK